MCTYCRAAANDTLGPQVRAQISKPVVVVATFYTYSPAYHSVVVVVVLESSRVARCLPFHSMCKLCAFNDAPKSTYTCSYYTWICVYYAHVYMYIGHKSTYRTRCALCDKRPKLCVCIATAARARYMRECFGAGAAACKQCCVCRLGQNR